MEESSFGIIPFRKRTQGTVATHRQVEFLLVHQRPSVHRPQDKIGHWGFPKGHAKKNETPVEAALRECFEETGIATENINVDEEKSFGEHYVFTRVFVQKKKLISKTAIYFLGRVVRGRVSVQKEEIEGYRWTSYPEARKLLTFPEAREVLQQAYAYLRGRTT